MAYIGEKPAQTLAAPTSQYFNGDGSTVAFTLNRAVNVAEDLDVFVNNVRQEPGVGKSYTAIGTTLTFDAAPSSGTANVYVVYRGLAEVTTRLELDPTNNISLADNSKAIFGDGNDLQIYHDGSNSFVNDTGTGNLVLRGANVSIQDASANNQVFVNNGGAVDIRYAGSAKLTTTSTGVDVTGTVTADGLTFGAEGQKIEFYTSSTPRPFITSGDTYQTNGLDIDSDNGITLKYDNNDNDAGGVLIKRDSDNKSVFLADANGDVSLYASDGTTQGFFWDASAERLGIGTVTPTNPVHIYRNVSGAESLVRIQNASPTSGANAVLRLDASGNNFFVINYPDADTSNANRTDFYSSAGSSYFTFSPASSEAMRIDSNGFVGIGTGATSPAGILDVRASATARTIINSTGDLIVGSGNGGDLLQLVDYGAPNETAANPYLEFLYASSLGGTESRLGYIGYGSGANTDMYIFNEASGGDIHLYTSPGISLSVRTDGEVIKPFQPSFMVTKTSDQTLVNVGGGTELVTWQSETWDVGGNFASNVFTAPVTGKYYLQTQMRIDNLDTAAGYYLLYITTSNRSKSAIIDPNFTGDLTYYTMQLGSVFDMDAGDTAYVSLYQSAGTASHIHASSTYTSFSGYLLG